MTARAEALSRRLMLLTGLLVGAIAVLFSEKIREEWPRRAGSRPRCFVERAANDCRGGQCRADDWRSGPQVARRLRAARRRAVFHVSPTGDILAAAGSAGGVDVEPADARTLDLARRGLSTIALKSGARLSPGRSLDTAKRFWSSRREMIFTGARPFRCSICSCWPRFRSPSHR
ncbi:MAG: hypothetical protein R3C42_06065 [Parvularculaceae bacterium]